MTQQTVLSVWAHPDDESFGPAGLVRSLHDAGVRTSLIIATQGEAGRCGDPPKATPETLAAIRSAELYAACRVLGVDRIELWDYPDGELKNIDINRLRGRILAVLTEEQPAVVLTFGPDGITGHPDHQAINAATTQAFAQYIANHNREISPRLYYITSTPDSMIPKFAQDTPLPLPPTACIDVSGYADIKQQALAAHASQHEDWEQTLSVESREWLTRVYLHRAYPPVNTNEPPETALFA